MKPQKKNIKIDVQGVEVNLTKSQKTKDMDWNIKRKLTKINYHIHTDAIKQNLIPPNLNKKQISFVYANFSAR